MAHKEKLGGNTGEQWGEGFPKTGSLMAGQGKGLKFSLQLLKHYFALLPLLPLLSP